MKTHVQEVTSIDPLNLALTAKSSTARVWWYFVTIVATVALLTFMGIFIEKHNRQQTTIITRLQRNHMPFPAVTFCNLNPYKKSALAKIPQIAQLIESYKSASKPSINSPSAKQTKARRKRSNPPLANCTCKMTTPVTAYDPNFSPSTFVYYPHYADTWACGFTCCASVAPAGFKSRLARIDSPALYSFLTVAGVIPSLNSSSLIYSGLIGLHWTTTLGNGTVVYDWYDDSTTMSLPPANVAMPTDLCPNCYPSLISTWTSGHDGIAVYYNSSDVIFRTVANTTDVYSVICEYWTIPTTTVSTTTSTTSTSSTTTTSSTSGSSSVASTSSMSSTSSVASSPSMASTTSSSAGSPTSTSTFSMPTSNFETASTSAATNASITTNTLSLSSTSPTSSIMLTSSTLLPTATSSTGNTSVTSVTLPMTSTLQTTSGMTTTSTSAMSTPLRISITLFTTSTSLTNATTITPATSTTSPTSAMSATGATSPTNITSPTSITLPTSITTGTSPSVVASPTTSLSSASASIKNSTSGTSNASPISSSLCTNTSTSLLTQSSPLITSALPTTNTSPTVSTSPTQITSYSSIISPTSSAASRTTSASQNSSTPLSTNISPASSIITLATSNISPTTSTSIRSNTSTSITTNAPVTSSASTTNTTAPITSALFMTGMLPTPSASLITVTTGTSSARTTSPAASVSPARLTPQMTNALLTVTSASSNNISPTYNTQLTTFKSPQTTTLSKSSSASTSTLLSSSAINKGTSTVPTYFSFSTYDSMPVSVSPSTAMNNSILSTTPSTSAATTASTSTSAPSTAVSSNASSTYLSLEPISTTPGGISSTASNVTETTGTTETAVSTTFSTMQTSTAIPHSSTSPSTQQTFSSAGNSTTLSAASPVMTTLLSTFMSQIPLSPESTYYVFSTTSTGSQTHSIITTEMSTAATTTASIAFGSVAQSTVPSSAAPTSSHAPHTSPIASTSEIATTAFSNTTYPETFSTSSALMSTTTSSKAMPNSSATADGVHFRSSSISSIRTPISASNSIQPQTSEATSTTIVSTQPEPPNSEFSISYAPSSTVLPVTFSSVANASLSTITEQNIASESKTPTEDTTTANFGATSGPLSELTYVSSADATSTSLSTLTVRNEATSNEAPNGTSTSVYNHTLLISTSSTRATTSSTNQFSSAAMSTSPASTRIPDYVTTTPGSMKISNATSPASAVLTSTTAFISTPTATISQSFTSLPMISASSTKAAANYSSAATLPYAVTVASMTSDSSQLESSTSGGQSLPVSSSNTILTILPPSNDSVPTYIRTKASTTTRIENISNSRSNSASDTAISYALTDPVHTASSVPVALAGFGVPTIAMTNGDSTLISSTVTKGSTLVFPFTQSVISTSRQDSSTPFYAPSSTSPIISIDTYTRDRSAVASSKYSRSNSFLTDSITSMGITVNEKADSSQAGAYSTASTGPDLAIFSQSTGQGPTIFQVTGTAPTFIMSSPPEPPFETFSSSNSPNLQLASVVPPITHNQSFSATTSTRIATSQSNDMLKTTEMPDFTINALPSTQSDTDDGSKYNTNKKTLVDPVSTRTIVENAIGADLERVTSTSTSISNSAAAITEEQPADVAKSSPVYDVSMDQTNRVSERVATPQASAPQEVQSDTGFSAPAPAFQPVSDVAIPENADAAGLTWQTLPPVISAIPDGAANSNPASAIDTPVPQTIKADDAFANNTGLSESAEKYITNALDHVGDEPSALTATAEDILPYLIASLPPDLARQVGYTLADVVLRCTYNGVACSVSDFTLLTDPNYGNCYTFNGDGKYMPAFEPGLTSGLSVAYYVREDEYVDFVSASGVRVVIHNQNDTIFADAMGFNTASGYKSEALMRKSVRDSMTVASEKRCISSPNQVEWFNYNTSYSLEGCLRSFYQENVIGRCSCGDPRVPLPRNKNVSYCSVDRRDCVNSYYIVDNGATEECNCPQPCKDSIYDVTVSTTKWTRFHGEKFREQTGNTGSSYGYHSGNEVAMIDVYFEDLTVVEYVEVEAYAIFDVLWDISSISGLFLGVSVLSLFEIVHLIMYISKTFHH